MDVVRRIMLSWEVLELGLRNFMSMIFVVGVAVVLVLVFVYRVYINKPSQFDILLRGLFSAKTRTSGKKESLEGKVCLITGASSGLGKATAKEFVSLNAAKVVLACLKTTITPELKEEIEAARPAGSQAEVIMVELDLADFDSIERCCAELDDTMTQPIDVLVLNAGVAPPKTILTKHRLELAFGINYVGHFLFTLKLLQKGLVANKTFCQVECRETGEKTGENEGEAEEEEPRIVVIGSEAHRAAPPLSQRPLGEVWQTNVLTSLSLYAHSKLCLVTWALELSKRLKGEVKVLTLCPGPMDTQIASGAPLWAKPFTWLLFKLFFPPASKAAEYVANLATLESFGRDTGVYFFKFNQVEPSEDARDSKAAAALWQQTEELIKDRGGSI